MLSLIYKQRLSTLEMLSSLKLLSPRFQRFFPTYYYYYYQCYFYYLFYFFIIPPDVCFVGEGTAGNDSGRKILWNASLHVVGRQVGDAGLRSCEERHLLSETTHSKQWHHHRARWGRHLQTAPRMNLWWWRCFSYLKVCTSGTSLRLWPLILWTSLAAAFIIFSTLFSCCCSSRVWREQKQRVFIPAGQLYCDSKKRKKAPSGRLSVSSAHWEQTRTQTLISPCNTWTEAPREAWTLGGKFTCFSACLRSSRKRSSSWTQAGSSFWPCCLAFSSCVFSSRSTRSSCASRACRVRDTCRSSSRSREVRSSPSRPLTGTGGWERMKGRG